MADSRCDIHALQQKTYKDVIKTAIILGHDTDTTACFTCGIVGLYFGFNAIPPQWFKQLRGKELVDPLLQKLY